MKGAGKGERRRKGGRRKGAGKGGAGEKRTKKKRWLRRIKRRQRW